MRNKYIFVLALATLFCANIAAQEVQEPEKRVIDTGASKPLSLEETTGAVSLIMAEDIERRSSKDVGNSILGQGLGLISLQNGGDYMDQDPTFYIRGLQTLSDNSTPLILVDGIERDLSYIAAEEVAYVVILKDAAAVALYGYKGINGAIQIVTKRGEYNSQTVKVTYDHQFNRLNNLPTFVNGYTYGLAINEARANDGLSARYSDAELAALRDGTYPYLYPNVDWIGETFRNTANTDNVNIEFRGGEEKFRYYAMLDLINDRGFIRNHNSNDGYSTQEKFVRGNLRLNFDIDLTPTTIVQVNVLGMLQEDSHPGDDENIDLWDMVYTLPAAAFPVKDADGRWAGSDTWAGTSNPVAQTVGAAYYKNHKRLVYTDLTIKQQLPWVEGLALFGKAGHDSMANIYEDHSMTYVYSVTTPSWPTDATEPTYTSSLYGSQTSMGDDANTNDYFTRSHIEGGVTYDRQFAKHSVNSQFKYEYEHYNEYGTSSQAGVNTTVNRQNISLWGHYGYLERYYFDLALVASGSSRLAPGTKWAFSPTASFAWVISKENFMAGSKWVNFLKLRASVGLLNADYLPDDTWTYYTQMYTITGGTYPFNSSFASEFGNTYLGQYATTNPSHEKAMKYNIGIDARFFGGLSATLDGYYQRRSGIWVDSSGRYSDVIGFAAPYENAGIVDSWGVEFGLDYNKKIGNWKINAGGNFNFNRNKIIEQLEEPRLYDNLVQTGNRIDQIYGLKAIGFFKDEDDIASSPTQTFTTVVPGDIKYEDVNNDGVIDTNDLIPIGYGSTAPEIYYNFHLGVEWKGLGFYALFQGVGNYSAILSTQSVYYPLVSNTTISQYYYDNRWTPENQNAKYPRLSSQSNSNNYRNNTVFLADRSFLKLRNVEVYYNMPEKILRNTHFIKGVKFYVRGQDIFCVDSIPVGDPEAFDTAQLFCTVLIGARMTF